MGGVAPMPGDGRPTAIFKQPVTAPIAIGFAGLEGDAQADLKAHGGPEKAVHHFPAETYARLAARFPEVGAGWAPGALGENISTVGIDEHSACVGDVYGLGSARVLLCQPRTPCWKIDARHGVDGIAQYVAEAGIAGWYYRVLAPGTVGVGDSFTLMERPADPITVAEFWEIALEHPPRLDALQRLAAIPGLSEVWTRKLNQRLSWLRDNT